MKAFDNGCLYSVTVSREEVIEFKENWPCSGLPSRSIWFQFSKRNGDLVEVQPANVTGEALLALSQDAQEYAKKKLGITH